MIVYLFIVFFALMPSGAMSAGTISAEQAIQIAKKDLCDNDFDFTRSCIQVIKDETVWNFYASSTDMNKPRKYIEIENKIKGKKFWAVMFYPQENATNRAQITAYIDATNGEIIDYEPYYPEKLLEWRKEITKEIPIDIAIEIADTCLTKDGVVISGMTMSIFKDDYYSLDLYPENNVLIRSGINNIKAKIGSRSYWLVYYRPKGNFHGGDACVFIDTITGEIIAIYK